MAEIDRIVVHGIVVEEDASFTLDSLCRACGAERAQVLALVGEGVLDPVGAAPELWLFDGPALRTTRTALRLAQDLELSLAGAALVLDLLAEIEVLRSHLRRSAHS